MEKIIDISKFSSLNFYVPKCQYPVYLKSKNQLVPCGHCALCVEKKKKDWKTRLLLETQNKPYQFLTLTLDDWNVDLCCYRHVQLFLKRLRRYIDYHFGKKVKYFGSFERGEKSGRPHWHILLIGYAFPLSIGKDKHLTRDQFFQKFWKYGFVKCLDCQCDQAIGYVVGYVMKKSLDYKDNNPLRLSRPEFNKINKYALNDFDAGFKRSSYYFMSNGIAFDYMNKNVDKLLKKGYITLGQYKHALPRYFSRKMKEKYDLDVFEHLKNSVSYETQLDFVDFLKNLSIINLREYNDMLPYTNFLTYLYRKMLVKRYYEQGYLVEQRMRRK